MLAKMTSDFSEGVQLMREYDPTMINLVRSEFLSRCHSRNALAIGGVLDDPATGAAAAALSGYLRDIG
jgi:predicted PhzF superfamily epimerase YddE/YHI9